MSWGPAESVETLSVATPPRRDGVPSTLAPSRKLTVLGDRPESLNTVAVKITFWPTLDGFRPEFRLVESR
jgi:hypothetical protein